MIPNWRKIEQIFFRSVCIKLVAPRMNLYQEVAVSSKKVGDPCYMLSVRIKNAHRHCEPIGVAKGAMPPKILENMVILCFERRFSKQNSVIRLKSNILPPLQNFWAGYATEPTLSCWWMDCKREVII